MVSLRGAMFRNLGRSPQATLSSRATAAGAGTKLMCPDYPGSAAYLLTRPLTTCPTVHLSPRSLATHPTGPSASATRLFHLRLCPPYRRALHVYLVLVREPRARN